MTKLLLLLVAVAVGAIVYPRYAERSSDVCGAFGKRLEALVGSAALPNAAVAAGLARPGAADELATAYLQARYPQVPATIRCTIAYWATEVNPDVVARLMPAVRPK